jgi:cytochrome b
MMRNTQTTRVWDPFVRLFHWSLVAAFAAAWVTAEETARLHEVLGYAIVALIGLRLAWGAVGPRHARFENFVRGPGAVARYLRDAVQGRAPRHLGHNPAGAAMILALVAGLVTVAGTGWAMTVPGFGGEALKEVHEVAASAMLVLVAGHVLGVVASSLAHRENLVLAMLTGNKRKAEAGDVA